MLVKDIMTSKLVTVPSNAPVAEAQSIMRENNIRRLPVIEKGKVVGMVTERRLERVKPPTAAPLLWQVSYLISRTTVKDIMRKDTVVVSPTDTVEYAVAKAQAEHVGSLLVMDKGRLVGICTTNDFFYKIVNPTLGLGVPGIRVLVTSNNVGLDTQKIVNCVNKLGIEVKVLWAIPVGSGGGKNIILHLGTEETDKVVKELEKLDCTVTVLAR